MKKIAFVASIVAGLLVSGVGVQAAENAPEPSSAKVTVVVDAATNVYDLAAYEAKDDVKSAKDYVDKYADNVQNDKNFREHEAIALATIHAKERFFGTWWAILPPLLAIFLALVTKEVYSSLFIGIVSGGLLYSGFSFEGTLTHVMQKGFISSIADAYNIGILIFLVLLGSLVAMMNKTGASAAFGRWAQTHIKSRVGAQVATIPGSSMTIVAVSACMAGAVCGDHCSPISDTTIMASAGAQCNHVVHVGTQLPYALLVAAVSFVAYAIAPYLGSAWVSLSAAVVLMLVVLVVMKMLSGGVADGKGDNND